MEGTIRVYGAKCHHDLVYSPRSEPWHGPSQLDSRFCPALRIRFGLCTQGQIVRQRWQREVIATNDRFAVALQSLVCVTYLDLNEATLVLSGSKMMVQSDRLRAGEKWKQNKKKDDDDEKTQRSEEEKSEVISWKKKFA